jgi:hypothetical protein
MPIMFTMRAFTFIAFVACQRLFTQCLSSAHRCQEVIPSPSVFAWHASLGTHRA